MKNNMHLWLFHYTHHDKRYEMEFDLITRFSLKKAQEPARHYNNIFKEGTGIIVFKKLCWRFFKSKKLN
ncbi:hypothetical protein MNL13_00785 [Bartonella krasnovii]|uniref:Uncharacterized protein n=1 Tax=Bartonella krasnovii TaxID=2267275 RepID=A0ABY3VVE6_9HYPH|nr:hypothetical protein [Bartonella krasnovii]UNF29356.1 hypothetical protein MNL13_00785 [Bartonella krasnovii]UNF35713.1 hypothetical protein MNL12_00785 [Bartonella krasnovii]UNF48900.1 hypothetical protein MNL04_00780 [Bartonella krasnovii]